MEVKTNQVIYKFSAKNKPVLEVGSGSPVRIHMLDCFSNQLRSPEDKMATLDWDRINPATGPVYIKDAEPGDVLKVTINRIELDEKGTVVSGEELGILGGILKDVYTKIVPIRDGKAVFADGTKIPVRPMIGVIGVAPAKDEINTGTPGRHGGNMDNTMVGEGASLYFNVEVPGALFACGDAHAVMGDGEIGVSGLEIPARMDVTFEVIKGKSVRSPMLENGEYWSVIASAEALEDAVQQATENMYYFLKDRLELMEGEIAMLMSLAGQLQFCQVVDPLKTVRFVMQKQYIGELRL